MSSRNTPSSTDSKSLSNALDLLHTRHPHLLPIPSADTHTFQSLQGLPTWICYGLFEYAIKPVPEGEEVDVVKVRQLLDEFTSTIGNGGGVTWDALLYYMWLRVGPVTGEEGWCSGGEEDGLGEETEMVGGMGLQKGVEEKVTGVDPDLTPRPRPRKVAVREGELPSTPTPKRSNERDKRPRPLPLPSPYTGMRSPRAQQQLIPGVRPSHIAKQPRPQYDRASITATRKQSKSNKKNQNLITRFTRAFLVLFLSLLVLLLGAAIPWLVVCYSASFPSLDTAWVDRGSVVRLVDHQLEAIRLHIMETIQGCFETFDATRGKV